MRLPENDEMLKTVTLTIMAFFFWHKKFQAACFQAP